MLMTTGTSHTTVLLGEDGGEATSDDMSEALRALDVDALLEEDAASERRLEEGALFDADGTSG